METFPHQNPPGISRCNDVHPMGSRCTFLLLEIVLLSSFSTKVWLGTATLGKVDDHTCFWTICPSTGGARAFQFRQQGKIETFILEPVKNCLIWNTVFAFQVSGMGRDYLLLSVPLFSLVARVSWVWGRSFMAFRSPWPLCSLYSPYTSKIPRFLYASFFSRPGWTAPWATWSGTRSGGWQPCHARGVPDQAIVWLYGSHFPFWLKPPNWPSLLDLLRTVVNLVTNTLLYLPNSDPVGWWP